MENVKLYGKNLAKEEMVKFDGKVAHYWWTNNIGEKLSLSLERINNRGWTFRNYTVGNGANILFFSRGNYEDVGASN